MGGPIKQGIMTGIREPYKHGGQAALVGNPVYPKTGGREHHMAAKVVQVAAPRIISKGMPHIKRGWEAFKNIFGKTKPATTRQKYHGYSEYGPPIYRPEKVPGGFVPKSWLARDPIYKGGKWIKEAVTGPTAKSWGKKIVQGAATPTGALTAAGLVYGFWPDGTPKTMEELIEDNVVRKGDKDYGPHTKGPPTITQEQRDAKAKADKEKRINALLDTMGYDKARKNAAYDALIDAGRMVTERGSLRAKDIGRELIDPIVATTSQRFDKPEQIREAVGLMQVKADIQKEMNKEETALANQAKRAQIAVAEKSLAGNTLEEAAEALFTRHGSWPSGEKLANLARNKGIAITEVVDTAGEEVGDAVEYMEGRVKTFRDQGIEIPPGNYVVDKSIIIIDAEGNVRRR